MTKILRYRGETDDLMKKEIIFNCYVSFCMSLHTSLYASMTVCHLYSTFPKSGRYQRNATVILPQNKQNCAAQTHKQGRYVSLCLTCVLHARSVYQLIKYLQVSGSSMNTTRSEPCGSHTKTILVLRFVPPPHGSPSVYSSEILPTL